MKKAHARSGAKGRLQGRPPENALTGLWRPPRNIYICRVGQRKTTNIKKYHFFERSKKRRESDGKMDPKDIIGMARGRDEIPLHPAKSKHHVDRRAVRGVFPLFCFPQDVGQIWEAMGQHQFSPRAQCDGSHLWGPDPTLCLTTMAHRPG